MRREGVPIARGTVARLLCEIGSIGVIQGKPVRTTISDKAAPYRLGHANRRFYAPAPNTLWVSVFTSVATWVRFVYVCLCQGGSSAGRPADGPWDCRDFRV